jgi:hypothetical protein
VTSILRYLKRHRETVLDPAVAAHNGRVVKLIGDGTIVEFASVVDAVNCALSVQRSGAPAPDHRGDGVNSSAVARPSWLLYGSLTILARSRVNGFSQISPTWIGVQSAGPCGSGCDIRISLNRAVPLSRVSFER